MNISNPIHDFRNGYITLRELTWNAFIFCNENNPEEILKEANEFELEALLKESSSLPNSEKEWQDFKIVSSYCSPLSPAEFRKTLDKKAERIRTGVEVFRRHIKEKG